MTESRYPSTAELAAFRRAYPPTTTHPHDGHVWPHERRDGIGARDRDSVPAGHPPCIGAIPCVVEAGDRHANARRKAAAARSRAYAAGAYAEYDGWAFVPRPMAPWQADR